MESSNYKTKNIKKKYLNTWYVWLIRYTPDLITETVGGFKDKVIKLFKTNAPKQTLYGRRQKLSEPKAQKQFEENIIKSIRNIFVLKKENKEIKDIIEISGLFLNKKMIIINRKKQAVFGITIILNMKVTLIEIESYHYKNTWSLIHGKFS